jgi:hypothetical protein
MKKILSALAVSTVIFAGASAQAGSTTGSATATVLPDIQVNQTTGLSFGTLTPGATGGTVAVSSTGTAVTGTVQSISAGARGAFSVQGGNNANYNINLPTSAITISNGTQTMDVALTLPANSGTLNGTGNGSFFVDGTLTVAGSQAAGTYNGTYTVNVNY